MLVRTQSAAIVGVEGCPVTVEAEVGLGLPSLTLVGRASGALQEARERVRAALAHVPFEVKPRRQIVNLAPAELRKDSPGNDLAIAVALLGGHGVVDEAAVAKTFFWGELALDGELRACPGTLVVAECARAAGATKMIVAAGCAAEAALIPGVDVRSANSLTDVIRHLRGESTLPVAEPDPVGDLCTRVAQVDMADVRGLAMPRLAVTTMVAGGHHLLLHGPPGVGKTMLARRAAALFPDLGTEEAVEVTKVHSVARAQMPRGLIRRPPVRMPHHTVSVAGLLGGGNPVRPGEVTLAHRGMLFLDETPEYTRACVEGLREPLEDGEVTIVRANYAVCLPARFQLMAAMNPCPCGYLGHPERTHSRCRIRAPSSRWRGSESSIPTIGGHRGNTEVASVGPQLPCSWGVVKRPSSTPMVSARRGQTVRDAIGAVSPVPRKKQSRGQQAESRSCDRTLALFCHGSAKCSS